MDNHIEVELEFNIHTLLDLCLSAHDKDITLNQLINDILREKLPNLEDEDELKELISKTKETPEYSKNVLIKYDVNRFEVIGTGRELVYNKINGVKLSLQDKDKTLKIFVDKGTN